MKLMCIYFQLNLSFFYTQEPTSSDLIRKTKVWLPPFFNASSPLKSNQAQITASNIDKRDSFGVSAVSEGIKLPNESFLILWGSSTLFFNLFGFFVENVKLLEYVEN